MHDVFTRQDAVGVADVEELDREGVAPACKLFARKEDRSGLLALQPPVDSGIDAFELFAADGFDNTEDVEVRGFVGVPGRR